MERTGIAGVTQEDVVMMPWVAARRLLGDRPLRFRLLTPPYAALGVGALRVLRVEPLAGEHDGAWELVAGYDRYERI
ncbi:MAG TPA: hypothetical protein VHT05_00295 [Candidatus Elarobacter sp.]|nr:hypothetical protein [Candidatus Elarobacter sp.]